MRRLEMALAAAGFVAGLALVAWTFSPRLEAWMPAGEELPATGSPSLFLKRPVDAASAEKHFSVSPPLAGQLEIDGRELTFWPAEPLAYGQTYTFTLRAGFRGANGLPSLTNIRRRYTVRMPRLVYLRQENGLANLYMWVEDSGERQLTAEPAGVWDYSVAPDGQGLVVSTINQDGSDDLILIDEDGDREVLLACTDSQCRDGRWQPGGRIVAYERLALDRPADEIEVWLLDMDSGRTWPAHDPELLADAGATTRASRFPRWSADGRYLAYFKPDARVIVVLDMAGGSPALIPANLQLMGEWSPAGRKLAYTELAFGSAGPDNPTDLAGEAGADGEPSLFQHLVVTDLDTGQSSDLSEGREIDVGRPAWSPDGQTLTAARSLAGGDRQLWSLSPSGDEREQLTDDPLVQHTAPAWSPDGHRLAFMRSGPAVAGGQAEIWLMTWPGADESPVVSGAFLPGWWP